MMMKNAASNFLSGLVDGIDVSKKTRDELLTGLLGDSGLLFTKSIRNSIGSMPLAVLIFLMKAAEINRDCPRWDILDNIESDIRNHLDSLKFDICKIRNLAVDEVAFMCTHNDMDNVHFILRDIKSEKAFDWHMLDNLWYFVGNNESMPREKRKSLLAHYENSFKMWLNSEEELPLGRIKGICKRGKMIDEYLPLVLGRAEMILKDFSLNDLCNMYANYVDHPNCKMYILFPLVKKYRNAKRVSAMLEMQCLDKLAVFCADFSEDDVCEFTEQKKAYNHFLRLLDVMTNPFEIEEIFHNGGWCNSNIVEKMKNPIKKRYLQILQVETKKYVNDLKWLWYRLWYCPFEKESVNILDVPLRNALRGASAEAAWQIASSCSGRDIILPYQKMARRRYVRWFAPRICNELDIAVLNQWMKIAGDNTKRKIISRVRELWSSVSFAELLAIDETVLSNKIQLLRINLLKKKLPEFLDAGNYGIAELLTAYRSWRPLDKIEMLLFAGAFQNVFAKMTRDELTNCEYDKIPDYFCDEVRNRFKEFIQRDIDDENLSIASLIKEAKNLPRIFSYLREILFVEARRRVAVMDIVGVEKLFEEEIPLRNTMEERYLELLPKTLEKSSEEELTERYCRCPEQLRKNFIEILSVVAGEEQ